MTTPLRASLIRLAHSNPELRPALLPLLKEAAAPLPDAAAFERTTKNLTGEVRALIGWCEDHPGQLPPANILKWTAATNGALSALLDRTALQIEELKRVTEEVAATLDEVDPTRLARRLERIYTATDW